MTSSKANKIIQDIIDQVSKDGIDVESVVTQLKELRPIAIQEKDPLLIRAIRLTYEHMEENDDFELNCMEEIRDEEDEDEEDVEEEEYSPEENLAYMLQLWIQSDNKYNRDEIRTFADKLTEMI